MNPKRTSRIEARFEKDDILKGTRNWSRDYKWVEVRGGESGTVWVSAWYVSERKGHFLAENTDYNRIKIRKSPVKGRITGYVKKGESIDITNVIMGWGKCSKGWVDLDYLTEIR